MLVIPYRYRKLHTVCVFQGIDLRIDLSIVRAKFTPKADKAPSIFLDRVSLTKARFAAAEGARLQSATVCKSYVL